MVEGKEDLFGGSAAVPAAAGTSGGARPGAGRPRGSLNLVNRDLRRYLEQLTGRQAIVEQYKLASMPVMDEDDAVGEAAVTFICRRFGCNRKEAGQLWLQAAGLVYPRIYPQLGSIEIKPPGAPGGERIEIEIGEFTDLTPHLSEPADE